MTTPFKKLDSIHPAARAAIVGAAVCLVGALLIQTQPGDVAPRHAGFQPDRQAVPQIAPAWSLQDADGTAHGLADLAGRPVLLNFWASWCPPCLDEMPSLQGLVGALADTELAVVAITLDENWADAQQAMARTGFGDSVLVVMDPDRSVAASYGTQKVPETYLIDPDGRIVHRFVGPREWNDAQLVADVRAFATQQPGHP